MHIESLELQRMSAATGLRLGDASDNHVTVNGIESAHSEYIYPVVTLIAQSDDAYVLFATEASTFYAISAQADNAVAVQVDVTATSGYLYLDGDYEDDDTNDSINDVQFAAALAVSAETLMTMESTTGSIVPAARLTLVAGSGLVVSDDMTSTATNSPLVMDVDFESEGDGTLTVWAGKTVTSNKSDVTITAWDVVMDGSLTAGTETISVHGSQAAQTVGFGFASGHMQIEGSEFQRITTSGSFEYGDVIDGAITINGVLTAQSTNCLPVVTLLAGYDDSLIAFTGASSSFYAISAQADNAVIVQVDVTTTIGAMYLDGDYENSSSADATNDVQFALALIMSAETLMTLESTTGSLIPAAKLTLVAGSGLVLLDDMTTTATNSPLVMDVDFESEGDGTVTVWAGKTVTSNKSDVTITAWDVVMDGSLTAGTESISVHGAKVSQTIGLGGTGGDMHVVDAEIGRLTARSGLSFGQSLVTGDISVDGLTDASTDWIGTLLLVATKDVRKVSFIEVASSFNKGITLQAAGGISLSQSVTTKNWQTKMYAGTGVLTLHDGMSFSTTNQLLTITADDVDVRGVATVSTGTAAAIIATLSANTIGIGAVLGKDTTLEGAEFGRITGTGITIGSLGVNVHMTITGLKDVDTNGVTDIVTLVGSVDDSKILFTTTSSTFHALSAQADNAVAVQVDVTATTNWLYLDGDYENSSSGDATNDVQFTDGVRVAAETLMTLESTTGSIVPAAKLTLVAGSGVMLLDDMTTSSTNSPLVMDVDFESEGDGTVTVWAGKTVTSNKSDVTITAWDVVMDGSLTAGTLSISVHGSKISQTIGIGLLTQNMEILDGELGRLTAEAGLTIGSSVGGAIQVKGVTDGSSDSVGTITLVAMKDGTAVAFLGTASAFNKGIVVQAMGGVLLSESVTTKNWPTLIYAGTGTLTTLATKALSTTNRWLTITADDIDFQGNVVTSGTAAMVITPLSVGRAVNFGFVTGASTDVDISDDEIAVITTGDSATGGLTIGSLAVSGSITVTGITTANSNAITGTLSLVATEDDSSITFATASSSFYTLGAQADNAVAVQVDVTAHTDPEGSMYLDGDYENSSTDDSINDVQFAGMLTVSAETLMTLESTTGSIVPAARLTLVAGSGVVLLDDMTTIATNSPLVMDVDFESEGDGTVTVWAGKTVTSNKSDVAITAWDVVMDGSLTAGTETISVHGSKVLQTIGLGGTGQDMHIESLELQRISATGGGGAGAGSWAGTGLRIANGVNGSVTVNGIESAHSEYVYPLVTLIAQSDDTQVTFATTSSTFHTLAAQADNGVDVEVDVTATIGAMYLDGDYENSTTADATNDVQFTDGVRVAAETLLTLESTTGSIVPAAKLTLVAGSGLVVLDDMITAATNSPLVMDVDFESEGDGTVTVWAGKTVTSNKSDVTITAWDVVMDGSLTAGTESISVHGAKVSQTIAIGASLSLNMEILDGELGRLTAEAGLTIGTAATGEIQVKGVTDGSSGSVGTITLVAMRDDTAVSFLGTASAFNKGIVVQAMGGVVLSESVTTKNWPTLIYAGTGTLKTLATKSLSSTNQLLTVDLQMMWTCKVIWWTVALQWQ